MAAALQVPFVLFFSCMDIFQKQSMETNVRKSLTRCFVEQPKAKKDDLAKEKIAVGCLLKLPHWVVMRFKATSCFVSPFI